MIVLKATQDKVLSVLQSVAGQSLLPPPPRMVIRRIAFGWVYSARVGSLTQEVNRSLWLAGAC